MGVKQFHLPDLGEGLIEAEIVEWHVAPGERVVTDQPLVSVETDKAVVEIPAPWPGTVTALLAEPGETLAVGAPLASFDTGERADTGTVAGDLPSATKPSAPKPPPAAAPKGAAPSAMPAARKLAAEHGIDLAGITGTGRGGIITRADVAALIESKPAEDGWEDLTGARKAMAGRMAAAAEVVRATVQDVADVSAWMAPDADLLARLVRATVTAAQAEPALNAWFDPQRRSRKLHDRVDLGIAVDTPDGLYVPVLRAAEARAADTLRAELDRLISTARARRLGRDDQAAPTLTLSSFGAIGGRHAELVVSPPQVAILGAGRAHAALLPGAQGPEARTLLPLSLSFDHRAVTGGEAARFIAAVIADLEQSG